jgi:hypothetical protein
LAISSGSVYRDSFLVNVGGFEALAVEAAPPPFALVLAMAKNIKEG